MGFKKNIVDQILGGGGCVPVAPPLNPPLCLKLPDELEYITTNFPGFPPGVLTLIKYVVGFKFNVRLISECPIRGF